MEERKRPLRSITDILDQTEHFYRIEFRARTEKRWRQLHDGGGPCIGLRHPKATQMLRMFDFGSEDTFRYRLVIENPTTAERSP